MKTGTVFQIKGAFKANTNVLSSLYSQDNSVSKYMRFGISIDEKDLMPYGSKDTGFSFEVSYLSGTSNVSTTVQMGRSGIYQIDGALPVTSIKFLEDTPQSVIINGVILDG